MQVYAATLTELVRDFAQRDGAKPALIFADQSISYADLDPDRASRESIGVVRNFPGDPGCTARAEHPRVRHRVLRRPALWRNRLPINVLCNAEEIAYIALATSRRFVIPSGTTGPSKGAMLTHRNLVSNCKQLDRTNRGCAKRSDVLLLVLPLFHMYAMNCAMNACRRVGATIVLVRRFDPLLVLEQIQKHRCNIFHGAPPMLATGGSRRRLLRPYAMAGSARVISP